MRLDLSFKLQLFQLQKNGLRGTMNHSLEISGIRHPHNKYHADYLQVGGGVCYIRSATISNQMRLRVMLT